MTTNHSLSRLTDAELLIEVRRLTAVEREATVDVIRSLCEVKARQLHLAIGCSSMFDYCTRVLHLSEHAAYARIAAAGWATEYPLIFELLVEGAITLTTVTLLGRHLTAENHVAVLTSARFKSKLDVERIVAALSPQPDVRSSVRKLPKPEYEVAPRMPPITSTVATRASPQSPSPSAPPPQTAVVRPLAPERYKLQVTISGDTRAKLRRAQDLLRHTSERGDEADVIDRALTVLIAQLEKAKFGTTDRPRASTTADPKTRCVPAEVRRAVSSRDGYRCAFVGSHGRCEETAGLEYHHRIPFADGGPSTIENLELRCRSHNAYEAEQWFGPLFVREAVEKWGLGLDQMDGSEASNAVASVVRPPPHRH